MSYNATVQKLLRVAAYLSENCGDSLACSLACSIIHEARYQVRIDQCNRKSGRRAARKAGERCRMIAANDHPVFRTIDHLSINEAVREAVSAARNAFWAHPELRVGA